MDKSVRVAGISIPLAGTMTNKMRTAAVEAHSEDSRRMSARGGDTGDRLV